MRQVPFASLTIFQGYICDIHNLPSQKKRRIFAPQTSIRKMHIHYTMYHHCLFFLVCILHIDIKLWMTNLLAQCVSFMMFLSFKTSEIKREGNIWLSSIEIIFSFFIILVHDLNEKYIFYLIIRVQYFSSHE
jgi:hypothetical protein